ncbi:hypothetical protein MBLNU230_g6003t1 [Neophaeotheca triangularis]
MASLICSKAPCARFATSASRAFAVPAPKRACFGTSSRQHEQQLTSTFAAQTKRPVTPISTPRRAITSQKLQVLSRPASTSSNAEKPQDLLTWNRFFDLRKKRRFINLGASAASAAVTVAFTAPLIANNDIDSWGAQTFGLDPVIVLGLATFSVAGAGWMCGPSFGNIGFTLWAGRRGWNKLIAEKEKSFYARIKRYRADPASSSPQNPIPDYYGEKIASVKDYRRWLKDQRAFNLKKDKSMF